MRNVTDVIFNYFHRDYNCNILHSFSRAHRLSSGAAENLQENVTT